MSERKKTVFSAITDSPNKIFGQLSTPCFVIDERKLQDNAEILKRISDKKGCKILLAQKAFSNYDFYKMLSGYLAGTEASGLYEARLGREEMPDGEVHVFSAAYREDEFKEILKYADHIVFNSINQLKKFCRLAKNAGASIGLRINPQCSTQSGHEIYDPCSDKSRLGVTRDVWNAEMTDEIFEYIDGIHFHTLCEQNSDDLLKTLNAVEEKFGDVIKSMKWLNMGGGHHITKPQYDLKTLEKCIDLAANKWGVQIYLEPGEAVALNAGFFICKVLDIVKNGEESIAILDGSAACHMPDVIEMPYTPPLYNADEKGKYKYRLSGPTCLAGDVIGDYKFKKPLKENDILVFGDMAIYTTCKTNTFNGMPLPDIWKRKMNCELIKLTDFGYDDFKYRLGRK